MAGRWLEWLAFYGTCSGYSGMPSFRHAQVDGVDFVHKRDSRNSISSHLCLTRYAGGLAAVVESPKPKDQISALLDLVDLHLHSRPSPTGVALLLDSPAPEAVAALEVLGEAMADQVPFALLQLERGTCVPTPPSGFDSANEQMHYRLWAGYLRADFTVPALVTDLIEATELVHHEIVGPVASKLVPGAPMHGIVEAATGRTFEEFDADVRHATDVAVRALHAWTV